MNSPNFYGFLLIVGVLYLSGIPEMLTLPLSLDTINVTQLSEESTSEAETESLTSDQSSLITTYEFENSTTTQLKANNSRLPGAEEFGNTTEATKIQARPKEYDLMREWPQFRAAGARAGSEVTIKYRGLTKDSSGNWVANRWAATFGNVALDTRFAQQKRNSKPQVAIQSNPIQDYYPPNASLSTVCMRSTIPYLEHKVMKWLKRHVYKHHHKHRPFYIELRRELFEKANADECHTPEMTNWQQYHECAIRRNMRIEALVPQYPMHQIVIEKRDKSLG